VTPAPAFMKAPLTSGAVSFTIILTCVVRSSCRERGNLDHMKKLITLAAVMILLSPCASRGASVSIQAEDFTGSYNIMPEAIRAEGGSLIGLDYAGEWATFQIAASPFGTYTVTMRCWGNLNVPYHFQLVTLPVHGEKDPETIDITYTGKGYCGQ
jgi:hypothetical protein